MCCLALPVLDKRLYAVVDFVFHLDNAMKVGQCLYETQHKVVFVTGGGLSNLLRLNPTVRLPINSTLPVLAFRCF